MMLSMPNNMSSSRRNGIGEIIEEQKKVEYKECLKNHAAAIGGIATDGCGEFMAAGKLGTIEALKCSACNCHRNFHRKYIQSDDCDGNRNHHSSSPVFFLKHNKTNNNNAAENKPINWGHNSQQAWHPTNSLFGLVSNNNKSGDDYDNDEVHEKEKVMMRKRFRTKFSQQQKEKMLAFAEKAEWKIQKVEDSAIQQFCQELGIKRRVLKVWMHNNKHNFANRARH